MNTTGINLVILWPPFSHCVRGFFYLDNLIVMAGSKEWAVFHTAQLILHLFWLGFTINWKKSSRQPLQQVENLGVVLLLLTTTNYYYLRQGATVMALTVMQVLGLLATAHLVLPLGLLHMQFLQRWFASLRLDAKNHKGHLVTVSTVSVTTSGVQTV